jgi:hypothetical protein
MCLHFFSGYKLQRYSSMCIDPLSMLPWVSEGSEQEVFLKDMTSTSVSLIPSASTWWGDYIILAGFSSSSPEWHGPQKIFLLLGEVLECHYPCPSAQTDLISIDFDVGESLINGGGPYHAIWNILTLNQPGSRKCVKYRGPFCFDLAFTRCKLTSPGICVACHRALRFQKSAQNGAAPAIQ